VEETVSGSGDDFAPDAISKRKSKGVTISQRRELKLLEHHPEIKTEFEGVNLDEFAGKKHDKNISVCSTPPQLRLKLLPFQAEALQWFKSQEDGRFKGGILADEMGMGKTIQMISLLLTDLPAKMHTLVITPTVALLQWKSELFLHTEKNSLSVFIYYGSACSDLTIEDLKKYNVVLTTYSSIESAYRRQHLGFRRNGKYVKKSSLLHSFHWDRIILDEAHHIKEKNTSTAQSAYKLEATFRWGLSGTPLQNRLGELYSLIKFLRIDPYAYYYWFFFFA
jgi:DNA repair protein RAD16